MQPKEFQKVLEPFPKKRSVLPDRYQRIYVNHYIENRGQKGVIHKLAGYLESWMHRIIQEEGEAYKSADILDFGAGNLNHLPYEPNFNAYDIVEPFKDLYKQSPRISKVRNFYEFSSDLSENKYDRILSVAVLEHLTHLPFEIAHLALHLKEGGIFQAGVPCEGEFAWFLGWKLTTGIAFKRKYNLKYDVLMNHEHVNTLSEILAIMKLIFEDVKIKRSPFPLPIRHASFYAYLEGKRPRKDMIEKILSKKPRT